MKIIKTRHLAYKTSYKNEDLLSFKEIKNIILSGILMLFLGFNADAQTAESIKGKPVKIGKLMIAENNFREEMNYTNAEKFCSRLGSGWRLPTLKELKIMCANKEKIGNFWLEKIYWSSTKTTPDIYTDIHYGIYFDRLYCHEAEKLNPNNLFYVRAVKSL